MLGSSSLQIDRKFNCARLNSALNRTVKQVLNVADSNETHQFDEIVRLEYKSSDLLIRTPSFTSEKNWTFCDNSMNLLSGEAESGSIVIQIRLRAFTLILSHLNK